MHGMPTETKIERLNLSLPTSLMRAIDDWRRQREDIPTRSEAARQLLTEALQPKLATEPRKPTRKP